MDFEVFLGICAILFSIAIIVIVVGAFVLVAGFIASALGLSGIMWWAVAIVSFIILSALAGGITVRARGE